MIPLLSSGGSSAGVELENLQFTFTPAPNTVLRATGNKGKSLLFDPK